MPSELLNVLPTWLVLGIAVGALASALVAGVFYFGNRLFPPAETDHHRVDGTLRRHAEIRSYLDTIDEPYLEKYERDGRTIEFYLPDRDVAITFDPQIFFALDTTETYVILCEDEMPAAQLGSRLPFEVPTQPRQRRRVSRDPLANAYNELGLQRGASPTAIRNAYRQRAKETHPDRGGSTAEFKQLQAAYTRIQDNIESPSR